MQVIKTALDHGNKNADGTDRAEHCCGCWHIESEDWQKLVAVCNECGEERDLAKILES